jgi:hypothetical protein
MCGAYHQLSPTKNFCSSFRFNTPARPYVSYQCSTMRLHCSKLSHHPRWAFNDQRWAFMALWLHGSFHASVVKLHGSRVILHDLLVSFGGSWSLYGSLVHISGFRMINQWLQGEPLWLFGSKESFQSSTMRLHCPQRVNKTPGWLFIALRWACVIPGLVSYALGWASMVLKSSDILRAPA